MENLNNKNSQLGYYLAGLIEGDGHIWVQTIIPETSPIRVYNPQIGVTFHRNEIPLFNTKDIFGTGSIYKSKIHNACSYRVSDKKALIKLINGKFRTPKIVYLHKAIDRINKKYNINIPKLKLDNSNLKSNV